MYSTDIVAYLSLSRILKNYLLLLELFQVLLLYLIDLDIE